MDMHSHRREFISKSLAGGLLSAAYSSRAATVKGLGIPGPFPGRVIEVQDPRVIVARKYQREVVRRMLDKGMMELTGAPSSQDAWKSFIEPGDVVGLKLNPVGRPFVMSAPEVVMEIIASLRMAGVPARNI